jgi:hypothetical protein
MTDGLCGALLDFTQLLADNADTLSSLLTTLSGYQTTLTTKQNEMATLVTGLKEIQNSLDIAQSVGSSTTTLLAEQTSQNALITTKQSEIDTVNANIVTTNASIATLNDTLSTSNNFTETQLIELQPFIVEMEWNTNSISNAQDLYDQAIIEFDKYNSPQTLVKVSLVNFLTMVSEQRNWNKLSLYDTIYIVNDDVDTDVKAKLVEINFDHVGKTAELTIADVSDLSTANEKVFKMIYQGVTSKSILSVNSSNWNKIDGASTKINALYNDGISADLIAINGGSGKTTLIDERGFTSTSSTNSDNFIRVNNGVMIFSGDGGQTANIGIDHTGIYANKLIGQIIAGVNLTVTNSSGSFTMDGSGVTISGASLTITGGLPSSQLDPDFKNGLVNLGTAYNGVKIDTTDGLVVTKSDAKIKTILNATEGILIQKNTGTSGSPSWSDVLSADTDGNLTVKGIIDGSDFKINGTSILTDNKILGSYIDSITTDQITAGTAKIGTAMIDTLTVGSNVGLGTAQNAAGVTTIINGTVTTSYLNAKNITAANVAASISITSPTITGGIFQTATSGNRVLISSGGQFGLSGIDFFRTSYIGSIGSNSGTDMILTGRDDLKLVSQTGDVYIDAVNVGTIYMQSAVDFGGNTVTGLNVVAVLG